MSDPPNDDGPVGYGKPPKAHKFKPGQTGNPKGRPKKKPATTLQAAIVEELQEIVTVNVSGQIRKMTQASYISKRLVAKAPNDIKTALGLMQLIKGAPEPSMLPGLVGAADRLTQKFKLIQERQKKRGFDGQVGPGATQEGGKGIAHSEGAATPRNAPIGQLATGDPIVLSEQVATSPAPALQNDDQARLQTGRDDDPAE